MIVCFQLMLIDSIFHCIVFDIIFIVFSRYLSWLLLKILSINYLTDFTNKLTLTRLSYGIGFGNIFSIDSLYVTGFSAEKTEKYRNLDYTVTISQDGDVYKIAIDFKGAVPNASYSLKIGEEIDYNTIDGHKAKVGRHFSLPSVSCRKQCLPGSI